MVTTTDWLKEWRTIVGALDENTYVPISARVAGQEYEVLRVSLFDEQIDGSKTFVLTTASAFEDKTALYSHLTRDIGLTRVITTKGRHWFILEPGSEVLDWISAVEKIALPRLHEALRSGTLWRGIAKRTRLEKKLRRLAQAKVRELEYRIKEAEDEANQLRVELRHAEKELARLGAE